MLFADAGQKIKKLSVVLFWIMGFIGTIAIFAIAALYGRFFMTATDGAIGILLTALVAFAAIAIHWILCWCLYLLLYGYGELIDKTTENEKLLRSCETQLWSVLHRPRP